MRLSILVFWLSFLLAPMNAFAGDCLSLSGLKDKSWASSKSHSRIAYQADITNKCNSTVTAIIMMEVLDGEGFQLDTDGPYIYNVPAHGSRHISEQAIIRIELAKQAKSWTLKLSER